MTSRNSSAERTRPWPSGSRPRLARGAGLRPRCRLGRGPWSWPRCPRRAASRGGAAAAAAGFGAAAGLARRGLRAGGAASARAPRRRGLGGLLSRARRRGATSASTSARRPRDVLEHAQVVEALADPLRGGRDVVEQAAPAVARALGAAGGGLEGTLDRAADGVDDVGRLAALSFFWRSSCPSWPWCASLRLHERARARSTSARTPTSPSACCCPAIPAARCGSRSSCSSSRRCSTTTAGCGATRARRADGAPLTIQSTGMGGPSAAIVVEELIELGARRLVRVGTCGALAGGLAPRRRCSWPTACCAEDGTSRALGAERRRCAPDPALLAALRAAAPTRAPGLVVSSDLFYDPDPARARRWARGRARSPWRWRRRRCSRSRRAAAWRRRACSRSATRARRRARGSAPRRSRPPRPQLGRARLTRARPRRRSLRLEADFLARGFDAALRAPAGLVDLEALLLARHWRGRRVDGAGQQRRPRRPASRAGPRSRRGARRRRERVAAVGELGEPLVEPVDAVLDALEALRDRPQPPREPLDVGRRRDVERAERGLLGLARALARLEGPGDRAVDQRVLQQVLRQLAEGVLALRARAGPGAPRLPWSFLQRYVRFSPERAR